MNKYEVTFVRGRNAVYEAENFRIGPTGTLELLRCDSVNHPYCFLCVNTKYWVRIEMAPTTRLTT